MLSQQTPLPKPNSGDPSPDDVSAGLATTSADSPSSLSTRRRNLLIFVVFTGVLIAADRASKLAALAAFGNGQSLVVIPGILECTLVWNRGAAFGLFEGAGPLFLAVALFVVGMALVYLLKSRQPRLLVALSLALIVAGAVGNAYDRLASGAVPDFLHLLFVEFPVFNLADCCLTMGEAGILLYILLGLRQPTRSKTNQD